MWKMWKHQFCFGHACIQKWQSFCPCKGHFFSNSGVLTKTSRDRRRNCIYAFLSLPFQAQIGSSRAPSKTKYWEEEDRGLKIKVPRKSFRKPKAKKLNTFAPDEHFDPHNEDPVLSIGTGSEHLSPVLSILENLKKTLACQVMDPYWSHFFFQFYCNS